MGNDLALVNAHHDPKIELLFQSVFSQSGKRERKDSVDLRFSYFPIFLVSLLKLFLLTCLLNYGISRLFLWILVTSMRLPIFHSCFRQLR